MAATIPDMKKSSVPLWVLSMWSISGMRMIRPAMNVADAITSKRLIQMVPDYWAYNGPPVSGKGPVIVSVKLSRRGRCK